MLWICLSICATASVGRGSGFLSGPTFYLPPNSDMMLTLYAL